MVRLLRTDNGRWYISRFEDEHNHALSVGSGQTRHWRSHNHLDPAIRDFVKNVKSNNISLGRIYGMLESTIGETGATHFTKSKLRSLCDRISRESAADDIGKTMRLLQRM